MGQQVRVARELIFEPGAIITGWGPQGEGRTYYVNNVTGSSTADGLSWNSAVAEVSDAITLSEAFRAIPATANEYIRNTILVQGTGTAYTGLTDLGEYYNLIGLGVPTGGLGGTIWNTTALTGMVRLGADLTSTGGMYDVDGEYQGVYMANIHFQTSGTNPAFGVDELYQCKFEDCAFAYGIGQATAAPNSWFEILSAATGLVMNRCSNVSNAAVTDRPAYGFHVKSGADRFTMSRMRDCQWTGFTAAFMIAATVAYGQGTIIGPDNFFGNFGNGVCTTGIKDLSTRTEAQGGLITYIHNYIDAHNPIDLAVDHTRFIDNRVMAGALTW